ncbi:hypothetical protein D3C76_1012370 [compost metagenome]
MYLAFSIALNQFSRTVQCRDNSPRVNFLLKTHASFGTQPQLARRFPNRSAVELGGLEQQIDCAFRYLGILATHNTRNGYRFHAIGNQQHMRFQLTLLTIQGHDRFAFLSHAYFNMTFFQFICIKGVQRLTVLQHHIVRDIYDVVNWTDTSSHQTVLHPERRRP